MLLAMMKCKLSICDLLRERGPFIRGHSLLRCGSIGFITPEIIYDALATKTNPLHNLRPTKVWEYINFVVATATSLVIFPQWYIHVICKTCRADSSAETNMFFFTTNGPLSHSRSHILSLLWGPCQSILDNHGRLLIIMQQLIFTVATPL